jgi:Holliday junction resolvase RusA-like endonuclease
MVEIIIPGVLPSANRLRREFRSPFAYKKLRERLVHDLAYALPGAREKNLLISENKGKKVRVEVVLYHAARFDPDNAVAALKPLLDAMVTLGYLHDDSAEWLQLSVEQVKSARKHTRTVIKISPCEPNSQ